ncbi:MAG: flagellar basal body P-ring protein FlgI [Rickettsiaceae bacterium]|nr:flagellar basal body P-ring protein FlgI [Rickettsiaceae bacterium]
MKCNKLIIFLILILASIQVSAKTRIKDITTKEGDRENLLVGHGLVVGLSGTGDNLKNAVFTEKGLTDFLERLGINVQGANLKTKNIAAVTVTAKLPAFARRGNKISVQVSAIGDAKSLRGGTLLATPLLGADGEVYALSQGRIAIADFNPISADVKNKSQTVETNGYIQDGAIVETEIPYEFASQTMLRFSLHSPDFSTAIKVAEVINDHIPGNTAKALDAATIEVQIPSYKQEEMIDFVADIETLTVEPDYKAKIVIDESTGTIVIGNNVSIAPVAIAHGNLIVNVGQLNYDQVYGPDTPEDELDLVNSYVDQKRGRSVHHLKNSATLSDLVDGLNKLGVYPRDMIDILRNMKSVGALNAVIEVR